MAAVTARSRKGSTLACLFSISHFNSTEFDIGTYLSIYSQQLKPILVAQDSIESNASQSVFFNNSWFYNIVVYAYIRSCVVFMHYLACRPEV